MRHLAACVLGLVCVLLAGAAGATPRYSLVVGQDCNLCHLNPTGGGVRDPYASQYLLPTRLAMQLGDAQPDAPSPVLGNGAVLGADLRTMWLHRDDTDAGNNFREMQASLYLSIPLGDPRWSIYVHQDFGQFDSAKLIEVWGMGYILPANGYVKAGRIVPAFGWRVPDHRSFTRRDFVFLPTFPPHSDTGVEIGIYPGPFSLEASVLNGQFQSSIDRNDSVALTARGQGRWSAGPMVLVAGGSWYQNQAVEGSLQAVGPFAGLRIGHLVWTAELDFARRREPDTPATPVFWSLTGSQELSVRIVQGLDAVGTYDIHDPDLDFVTGALHRIGFGVDALARSFLQLSGRVHFFRTENPEMPDPDRPSPPGVPGPDWMQTQLVVHLLY